MDNYNNDDNVVKMNPITIESSSMKYLCKYKIKRKKMMQQKTFANQKSSLILVKRQKQTPSTKSNSMSLTLNKRDIQQNYSSKFCVKRRKKSFKPDDQSNDNCSSRYKSLAIFKRRRKQIKNSENEKNEIQSLKRRESKLLFTSKTCEQPYNDDDEKTLVGKNNFFKIETSSSSDSDYSSSSFIKSNSIGKSNNSMEKASSQILDNNKFLNENDKKMISVDTDKNQKNLEEQKQQKHIDEKEKLLPQLESVIQQQQNITENQQHNDDEKMAKNKLNASTPPPPTTTTMTQSMINTNDNENRPEGDNIDRGTTLAVWTSILTVVAGLIIIRMFS